MHIHFGCYLYQRRINCVNESLFYMLSNHICTHGDTFLWKETTCVSHINGKGDRGTKGKSKPYWTIERTDFQMPCIWIIRHELKTTECEHQFGHGNYAQCKFYLYVSIDVTADAASCWTLAAFRLTLEKSEPKIWMHIKHCLITAMQYQFKKHKNCKKLQLHPMLKIFVSDAWLAPWIFLGMFVPNSLEWLCKTCTICQTRFI